MAGRGDGLSLTSAIAIWDTLPLVPGFVHPDFESVRKTLHQLALPRVGEGGVAVAVYHRGELVANWAAGTRNAAGDSFLPNTLCVAMSTSKAVVATLIHVLVDRGVLAYDAPVATYWPEFAQNGKDALTLRHVLAHASGLYAIADLIDHARDLFDWEHVVRAIETARPRHVPGASFGYHAWTSGFVLGEVAQRATGARLDALLREHLFAPLGIDGAYIGLPADEEVRAADVIMPSATRAPIPTSVWRLGMRAGDVLMRGVGLRSRPSEAMDAGWPPGLLEVDLNGRAFRSAAIPSVNGMYTAHALARLFAPLASRGLLGDTRLLSAETLAEASQDQGEGVGVVVPFPLRFKLGYMRPVSLGFPVDVLGRRVDVGVASPDAFGHFGFGGSGAWADPARELSVGVVANSFFGALPIDIRTVALATAAARCADRRR